MGDIRKNSDLRFDKDSRMPDIRGCNIGKLKFQNEAFQRTANEKLSSYIQEMVGVVGIKEGEETFRVDYDGRFSNDREIKKASEDFKRLF